jgi:hypothetical protein
VAHLLFCNHFKLNLLMTQSWKYAACLLALAACSEKHPATTEQATTGQPTARDTSSTTNTSSAINTAASLDEAPTPVAANEVPAAQRLPGKLLEGWHWKDANGENLLVVYRTEILSRNERRAQKDPAFRKKLENPNTGSSVEDIGRGSELMVRQYVRKQGAYTELWRLQDGVYNCPVDLILGPASHSTTITDLDQNGQSETTFIYALGCRGDVSSDDLKLVMHEGKEKYALRGNIVVQVDSTPVHPSANPCCIGELSKAQLTKLYEGPDSGYMGRYFSEADFKDKPAFLKFARLRWQQYSVFDAAQAEVQ